MIKSKEHIELSIVMPCLNEAETLAICIQKAKRFLIDYQVSGEIIVGDNGSTDGSQQIARDLDARVVDVPVRGYGAALNGAIEASRGTYIIMGDSDDSYDFSNLDPFVNKLREGYDLVMGNRFKGGVKKGAMPFLHRYLGNPVLSMIGRVFFNIPVGDFHCGLRGFKKSSYKKMHMHSTGMEFASELVVKASMLNMRISEVPTVLSPDGRSRKPHLRTWRDGWRHLRFLLIYAPDWLFLYPGIFLTLLGAISLTMLSLGPVVIGGITFDVLTLLYSCLLVFVGTEFIFFYLATKLTAFYYGFLLKENRTVERFDRYFTLERGLFVGAALFILGLVFLFPNLMRWQEQGFQSMDTRISLRTVVPSFIGFALSVQIVLYSFFISILRIKRL